MKAVGTKQHPDIEMRVCMDAEWFCMASPWSYRIIRYG